MAGYDVTFIEQWPAHVEAIREKGITVNLPSRTINAKVKALHFCQVAEIKEKFDLVFLVVKAYDTKWVTQMIDPVSAKDGFVIGLQNGMTHVDIASVVGARGRSAPLSRSLRICSCRESQPVRTTMRSSGSPLERSIPVSNIEFEDVAKLLRCSGRVEVSTDIKSCKWMKLVVNAAELIPSAILNLPLADAARTPGFLEVMRRAGYEAMQAALLDGASIISIIGLPPIMTNDPERYVDRIFDEVLTTFSRPDTLTTSLQDWRKGRRAEIQEVNGYVIDILRKHGIEAPINQRFVEIALDAKAAPSKLGRISRRTSSNSLIQIDDRMGVEDNER